MGTSTLVSWLFRIILIEIYSCTVIDSWDLKLSRSVIRKCKLKRRNKDCYRRKLVKIMN